MTKKYELTTETKLIDGHKVYRIKALKSFDTIIGRRVNKGDLGGWVESEKNLSQGGTCWLFDDAAGYENSLRCDNSVGYENSRQYGKSWQSGDSQQSGTSQQSGISRQFGNSAQSGNSQQFGNSWQSGNSEQSGNSTQSGNSQQHGDSRHITGDDDGTGRILCIGPCGDSQRTVTVQPDNTIVAGCFHGSFRDFKRAVVAKYGKNYGTYSTCIAILQTAIKKSS